MIDVILPVIRRDDADLLFSDMEKNTIEPTRVIVIDNTGGGYFPRTRLPVLYISPPQPLGVNASWNIGSALARESFVSFLNDDLRISSGFFDGIVRTFNSNHNAGVVCPQTSYQLYEVSCRVQGYHVMNRREGWAFTMRRELLHTMPEIPDQLKIFCGDDWYWHWTHKLGKRWIKQAGNIIYHQPGASALPKYKATLKAEKALFAELIDEVDA